MVLLPTHGEAWRSEARPKRSTKVVKSSLARRDNSIEGEGRRHVPSAVLEAMYSRPMVFPAPNAEDAFKHEHRF